MTLTFDIHIGLCTHLLTASTNFDIDCNSFWNIHCFTLFPHKSIRDQIWPCCKIDQGQPRIIIWTNLVVLEHPMLHTNFQGRRPIGSREDFLRFLPCMGKAATLVMWPGPFEQIFVTPSQGGSTWNLTCRPSGFRGDVWNLTTRVRTHTHLHMDNKRPTYTISSSMGLKA